MKGTLIALVFLSLTNLSYAHQRQDLLTFKSNYSVSETSERLSELLKSKGFTIFTKIEHSTGAKKVGIDLPETELILFGNPKIGSKLMLCSPTIAIDLPQKALIWKKSNNEVWLAVNNPDYLKQRHKTEGCDPIFGKIKSALTAIATKVSQ
jgi:uncharacterized protein (DUF302 family)